MSPLKRLPGGKRPGSREQGAQVNLVSPVDLQSACLPPSSSCLHVGLDPKPKPRPHLEPRCLPPTLGSPVPVQVPVPEGSSGLSPGLGTTHLPYRAGNGGSSPAPTLGPGVRPCAAASLCHVELAHFRRMNFVTAGGTWMRGPDPGPSQSWALGRE